MSIVKELQQPHVVQGDPVQTYNIENMGPTPIIVIKQKATTERRYATTTSVVTGVMQVVAGILSIVFQTIALIDHHGGSRISSGIWCGIFFLIPGSLGIAAGKTKNKYLILVHLLLCIIAPVFALLMLIIASFDGARSTRTPCENCPGIPLSNLEFSMYMLLVILSVFEAVVAIIGSAISCCGLCCNGKSVYPGTIQYISQPGTAAAPMVYNPHTGFIVTPGTHILGNTVLDSAPPPYYCDQETPQDSLPGVHKTQHY